jgi:predicted Zn-dependent protease
MALNALKNLDEHILAFFDISPSPKTRRIMRLLSIGAMITAALAVSYWGYQLYAGNREKNAQKELAACMELYEKAAGAGEMATLWPSVEMACKLGHERYSGSSLAPYFLSYQADALIKQNKMDEAITIMNEMVHALSPRSPLYHVYATKHALMQMDATDNAVRAAGLLALEKLAADTNNEQRDEALYYLGLYHWHNNDASQAKEAWQTLMSLPGSPEYNSPWISLVTERLKLLA